MSEFDFPAYPERLHHQTPSWVKAGAMFHIRLRVGERNKRPLIDSEVAKALFDSVEFCQTTHKWFCYIFLLMPDHAHALIAFPKEANMARMIGDWKRYTSTRTGALWQPNFFDHRIRNEQGLQEKAHYIRRNPVVKGLCRKPEDWAYVWTPEKPARRSGST